MLQTVDIPSRPLSPLRTRRGPRAEEIVLMQGLASGPRAVTEGPIGRCVKRGWCRALLVEANATGDASPVRVVFALTDTGRGMLAHAEAPFGRSARQRRDAVRQPG